MKKLLLLISGLLFFISSFAQNESSILSYDFDSINDTIQYKKAFNDFKKLMIKKKYEEAQFFADKLIEKSINLELTNDVGSIYLYKANMYRKTHMYFQATNFYEKAAKVFMELENIKDLSAVYNARFVMEYHRGNLEKSTDYLLEAKMYSEKLKDSSSLILMYNNLGSVYATLKNYDEAKKYMEKAIDVRKKIGRLDNIGMVMNNLAYVYSYDKNIDKAKEILVEALAINKKDSLPESIAHSYSIMGEVAILEKEYETAIAYYNTSLEISKNTSYDILTTENKQQLGYLHIFAKNYDTAEKFLKESRIEFEDLESTQHLLSNYKFSSSLDSARGNLKSALAWQKKYQELSDDRMNDLSTKKIERAEARYQAELEQLRRIDEQEKRELRTKEELFRYRIFTFIVLGILVISLVFLLWVIKTRRERKILITNLDQSNQIKNKLFSIISHDLKNEIYGLEASLNLMKENEMSSEEFEEIIPTLANRTHQTSILLNNLLNWSKSQLKELSAKPVNFDVTEIIKTKFTFFKAKASQKNIQLINNLDSTKIFADKDMVSIVAQNLIANAIKFCKSGDTISLVSREKENHYEIGFSDTGVGIAPDNIKKLFAEDTFTTNGTQNESGTGLGLKICKELIELNQGNIKVESILGKGSTFYISLPKAA